MSQHANIFDPQIENTYCVFLENKFQQRELRFLLRKVILVERRNTTFRANITIWFILAKVSIFHGSSPYTQDADTGQVVAFWIVHKDQVKPDIEVWLQSNCTHKVGSSPAMEPCGAKTSLGVSFKPLSQSIFCLKVAQTFRVSSLALLPTTPAISFFWIHTISHDILQFGTILTIFYDS